ncbi:hypothetical protein T265_05392 [Opisthorchis viverrini]|uniref:Uncharacterized protein n=1 Tax=Opisthorchis viverrini TaxID=6198 RepID=A0A074ZJQ3_OPIVI|nr:hypothetical protein T265_05392 [Opisthorchis viverrini]KER27573.1 hypothetical protein T265_05392 [Opisthorchis viverrini]
MNRWFGWNSEWRAKTKRFLIKETTHKVAENSLTAHDRFRPSWDSSVEIICHDTFLVLADFLNCESVRKAPQKLPYTKRCPSGMPTLPIPF